MKKEFTKFNKFTLIKKIAHGGMAEIFLACVGAVTQTQRFVVLKKILPSHSHNKEFAKMFKNEGKIVANLSHSNVASIYEFGLERDQHFICMEYISGRHLRQLIQKLNSQKKQLSIQHSAHIIKNICLGLDYAHNYTDKLTGKPMNIIHRDISPQNIMIGFNGEIKLIDFGIAKAIDMEATRVGILKGKLEYMSPEQVKGESLNHQTDIFSIGAVLWELLAGRKLFTAADELSVIKKIKECRVPDLKKINPKIPDRIIEITNKALNLNKNIRYTTTADMSNDISVFLNTEYPNFTPTHFNSFIKNLYIEEILEERQYLKDCASILINQKQKKTMIRDSSSAVYDQTNVESNTFVGHKPQPTYTKYTKPSYTETYANQHTEELSYDETTGVEPTHTNAEYTKTSRTTQNPQVEITKTKFEDDLANNSLRIKKQNDISNLSLKRQNGKPKFSTNSNYTISEYTPYTYRTDLYTKNQRIKALKRKAKQKNKWLFLATLLVAGIATFAITQPDVANMKAQQIISQLQKYIQPILGTNNTTIEIPEPTTKKRRDPASSQSITPTVQLVQPAPTITKTIFLDTKPSGAIIYINNKKMEQLTPTIINIPIDQTVLLTLQKKGYYLNKKRISSKTIKDKLLLTLKKVNSQGEKDEVIIVQ